jgi:hypothetical protein
MDPNASLVGQVLDDRFEILSLLGEGGMGQVFLARQVPLGVTRAIKLISSEAQDHPQVEARFRREAITLARLEHPGIVRALEFGRLPWGGLFMVMEHVRGLDTQRLIDSRGPMRLADALTVLQRIAEALAYAHRQGVVHRDLKPANVILEDGDPRQAKIIDFGLVKLVGDWRSTQLTGDAQILGTPHYLAPEQCLGADVGPAADVYALAGLAYTYLSGRPVFPGKTVTALILHHCHEAPEPLTARALAEPLPAGLEALLLRCLAKDPAARPAAAEIEDWLAAVQAPLAGGGEGRTLPGLGETVLGPVEDPAIALARQIFVIAVRDGTRDDAQRDLADALRNQISAVLRELAAALGADLPEVVPASRRLDQLEEDLSALELDAALISSQLDELGAQPSDQTAVLRNEAAALARRAADLAGQVQGEYVALFASVARARQRPVSGPAADLVSELDELVAQFRGLPGGRPGRSR